MGRIIVEQIISADGYAADAEGGIGFFENAQDLNLVDSEQQLRMLEPVHAIVFGRRTYEMFVGYWPETDAAREPVAKPINALPKYVVSRTLDHAPWGRHDSAKVLDDDGVTALRRLRHDIAGDIMIWGSLTLADALLRAGEVDVLRLRMLPVLIGAGRSFNPQDAGVRTLSLEELVPYPSGLVVLQYRFDAPPHRA